MRKISLFLILTSTLSLFTIADIEARGGPRGGGRGGGRGGAPRHSFNRGPSMSRSHVNYRRPPARTHYTRPPIHTERIQRTPTQVRRTPTPARPGTRGRANPAVSDFLRSPRPSHVGRVERPTPATRQDRREIRTGTGDHIRQDIKRHGNEYRNWYGRDFWKNNPHPKYRLEGNRNWWRGAAWGSVASWLPWYWTNPIYYNYGDEDSLYYDDGMVYINGKATYTEEEYAQQAEEIATDIPDVDLDAIEWLPIGVYAMTQDSSFSGDPTMFLQLTVSKEGIIAGTYQNTFTQSVQAIEGMVDEDSQRAAWTIVDKNTPIMETTIGNLTKEQAPALIHFADGSTQKWLMVKLEQP